MPGSFRAGQIVIADWRDGLPKETNKLRPAIVVEDDGLVVPNYPNILLVPITEDDTLTIRDLVTALEPTEENGCTKPCWAISHMVTATPSRITGEQLAAIRRQIALAVGVPT